ncbi:MAG TPA: ATP-binding cassette domain-containing protein, partial [Pseudonocardiaceae bacterium]|nr:ATP-binding cassette domain-containing protein [Pseudonocardiaceae bacterium]
MSEAILGARRVGKTLTSADGQRLLVNDDVTLRLAPGEFVSVVGPSGAGKTTLLRTLSGLATADTGTVDHRGRAVRGVPPWVSIVFQDYTKTLFPWLSIEKNVRLAVRDRPRAEAAALARDVLDDLGLGDFVHRYPWELSGGMQQRAALARAMVCHPELLFMDEPFASV